MERSRIQGRVPNNPFAQALSVVAGLLVVGAAFFLGLVFLAIFLGLFAIAGIAIAARVWWIKRKLGRQAVATPDRRDDTVVLEGEYVVVEPPTEESGSEDRQ